MHKKRIKEVLQGVGARIMHDEIIPFAILQKKRSSGVNILIPVIEEYTECFVLSMKVKRKIPYKEGQSYASDVPLRAC